MIIVGLASASTGVVYGLLLYRVPRAASVRCSPPSTWDATAATSESRYRLPVAPTRSLERQSIAMARAILADPE
eukprot:2242959-Rhodomonas_salina.2